MLPLEIAPLLRRAAALQGRAVPLTRIEFFSYPTDDFNLTGMSTESATAKIWGNVFPKGGSDLLTQLPDRIIFPTLWFGTEISPGQKYPANKNFLLIRGSVGQKILAEDFQGNAYELTESDFSGGNFLALRTLASNDTAPEHPDSPPTSARGWFIHAIYKRRKVFFEGALATLLVGFFGLSVSLYTMQVYDRVIPLRGYSTLIVLTIGVAIAILMELAMRQIRAVMVERACKAIDYELSDVFFSKALSIRLDMRPKTVGTFASQIRHFESVRNFMTGTTLMLLADVPLALFFILAISLISGAMFLLPLVALPVALMAGFAFSSRIKFLTKEQIEESNYKNGLLIEAIDGVESLKASGAEWKMQSKWSALTNLIGRKELRLRLISSFSSQTTQTIHQIAYLSVVGFGAYSVAEGSLTMGGLIACTILTSRALQPIVQVPSVLVQWQTASASLDALDAIMNLPDDRPPGQRMIVPEICRGGLRLERVKFGYDQSQNILDIRELQIKSGERVGILGAVGSGKSTLIKILSGLYKPSSGMSFLDDIDVFQIAPEFVCEHIGYLPQDVRLFSGTLRDNLTLGLPNPPDQVIVKAAEACGLAATISRHPSGLGLPIQEGGRGLSGGQRQLVGLTRMLIARPSVLLLDEPTASMDSQMEASVLKHLVEGLPKTTTILMATHKLATLKFVDRVLVIHRGVIVMDGPRDEVLTKMKQTFRVSTEEIPLNSPSVDAPEANSP